MHLRDVLTEAARNVWTGVSRPLVLAGVFALVIGGMVVLDVRMLVNANNELEAWRDAGASISVVYADDGIDGAACEALADAAGITGAGAMRTLEANLPLPALPLGSPGHAEVTPGFARLIATAAGGSRTIHAATPDSLARGGVLLTDSLAATLDRGPGSTMATGAGKAIVAGAYAHPDDGRQSPLTYTVLAQVPAQGRFDYCWAEVWPPDSTTTSLLLATADPNQPDVEAGLSQLNSTLGTELDPVALYRDRVTRYTPVAALVAGILVGFIGIRLRRLELASSLHAEVTHTALRVQVLVETVAWLLAGVTLVAPAIWFAARLSNPLPPGPIGPLVYAALGGGAAGTLTGALLGLALTREAHLFRYFKAR